MNDWVKVKSQLKNIVDPADNDGYVSKMNYGRFVDACRTLSNFLGDPMFDGIHALTIKLVGGLVHGAIAVAVSTSIRAAKSLQRKNASGEASRRSPSKRDLQLGGAATTMNRSCSSKKRPEIGPSRDWVGIGSKDRWGHTGRPRPDY